MSGGKKKAALSPAEQLKKIDKDRLAVVKILADAAEAEALAEDNAAADAAIAAQVIVDNNARRALPLVEQVNSTEVNELDSALAADGVVAVEETAVVTWVAPDIIFDQLDSRVVKLEKLVLKLSESKATTQNDLTLNITDPHAEGNSKLQKQLVSRVCLDRKVDKINTDLRQVIDQLEIASRGRSATPPSQLAGSASRKRSAKD